MISVAFLACIVNSDRRDYCDEVTWMGMHQSRSVDINLSLVQAQICQSPRTSPEVDVYDCSLAECFMPPRCAVLG